MGLEDDRQNEYGRYGPEANRLRIRFDFGNGIGEAQFVRVCEKCGGFVKVNEVIRANDITGLHPEPNAVCSKCGPTRMLFEGFF